MLHVVMLARWEPTRRVLQIFQNVHFGKPYLFMLRNVTIAASNFKKKREHHFYEDVSTWRNNEQFFTDITKGVLFEDDNIVALQKPNGVPMAGSMYNDLPSHLQPSDLPNNAMLSLIPMLQEYFKSKYLKEVYTQPRLYSGPVIFAKNDKAFNILQKHYKSLKIQKKTFQSYILISIGEPKISGMPVDFPVHRIQVGSIPLSEKCLEVSKQARKRREVAVPVVEHSILDSVILGTGGQVKVALNSININLCKWDILETYMVDSCLCKVLGDHTYSSRLSTIQNRTVRLSPKQCKPQTQELPYEVLKALGLDSTRSLVHHIPVHIHCTHINVPDLSKSKAIGINNQITVKAPVPEFFKKTMSLLGLNYDNEQSVT